MISPTPENKTELLKNCTNTEQLPNIKKTAALESPDKAKITSKQVSSAAEEVNTHLIMKDLIDLAVKCRGIILIQTIDGKTRTITTKRIINAQSPSLAHNH